LKTGFIVGATPKYQQYALFIGAIVSSLVIGLVVKVLDIPTPDLQAKGIEHAIGEVYAAPQATLMATLARGILSFNLDWQFVMVGVFIAITLELCGIKALAFAIGLYLPLSTTLPIFIGGAIKGIIDWREENISAEESELSKGNLFATGLVAGGALMGVIAAILLVFLPDFMGLVNLEHALSGVLGAGLYEIIGTLFFVAMALMLYRLAIRKAG
jgi:putative OPT family oligopeptide transporter